MNEKGRIKDRLRTWFFYLRKKSALKKKQKKLEEERIRLYYRQNNLKYYSKPKVIMLTFLGLFLAFFEKKEKEEKIDLTQVKTIKIIKKDEQIIDEIIYKIERTKKRIVTLKEVKVNKKEIDTILTNTKTIDSSIAKLEKKYKIKRTDNKVSIANVVKVDFIREKIEVAKEKSKEVNKIINEEIKPFVEIKENSVQKEMEKKDEKQKIIETLNNKHLDVGSEIEIINPVILKEEILESKEKVLKVLEVDPDKKLKDNLKQFDEVIKKIIYQEELEKKLKEIKKLEELNHNHISIENERKIKKLKEKVEKRIKEIEILKQRQKQDKKDFEKIMKFKEEISLVKTNKELAIIKEKINDFIFENEKTLSKDNLYKIKEIKAIIIIKSEKIKKNAVKKTEDELAEIFLMEVFIYNKLKTQKKEVEKFKEKINSLSGPKKRGNFLRGISVFVNRSIKLAFSLFPLYLFKNKTLGFLTSTVLVNNSIRGMRNMMNEKEIPFIEHKIITEKIKQGEEAVERSYDICYDSLEQIDRLKEDFMLEVGYENSEEISNVMSQMNQLENMVKSRINELVKTNEHLKTMEKNVKVKRLEINQ
jgi:hypothetical protein